MKLSSTCRQLLAGGILSFSSLMVAWPTFADGSAANSRALVRHRLAIRDRDHDGLPDSVEKQLGTSPRRADSNNNGIWDGDENSQSPGMTRLEAFEAGAYRSEDEGESDGEEDDGGVGPGVSTPRPNPTCRTGFTPNCKAKKCTTKRRKAKKCRPTVKKPTHAPTPRPSGNPTPRPTPQPAATPSGSGNFDANGNTTKFGIPAGIVGNINAGGPLWSGNCSGCHGGEKLGRSFGQIKSSFSIPAMAGIRLSDPQVANLVAYLNRLNR